MLFRVLRCLVVVYKEENLVKSEKLENNLIFLGIIGSIDFLRKEVVDVVLKCKLVGIKFVMIIGDY